MPNRSHKRRPAPFPERHAARPFGTTNVVISVGDTAPFLRVLAGLRELSALLRTRDMIEACGVADDIDAIGERYEMDVGVCDGQDDPG